METGSIQQPFVGRREQAEEYAPPQIIKGEKLIEVTGFVKTTGED